MTTALTAALLENAKMKKLKMRLTSLIAALLENAKTKKPNMTLTSLIAAVAKSAHAATYLASIAWQFESAR